MGKMELEVKILDINKEEFIKKIEELGAILKENTRQYLYTYDLPTIYGRFVDILFQLNNPESIIKYETAIERLKLLFFELDNLLTEKDKEYLNDIIGHDNISVLCGKEDISKYLNNTKLTNFIKQFNINPKKWIRLRRTNGKTTIAVKHVLAPNETKLQQMLETEIEVSSMREANDLLEALGYSHKSYQEKERISYIFENHEIDIDTWPGIPTYFEVEGSSEEDLDNILKKLGYSLQDSVSCTADDIYVMYGNQFLALKEN